jgi:hypothetical protein
MEHTPGPWGIPEPDEDITYLAVTYKGKADTQVIAIVNGPGSGATRDSMIANARLIAAAPELLRGCNAALAYLADPASKFTNNRTSAAEIIRAAIAKATGNKATPPANDRNRARRPVLRKPAELMRSHMKPYSPLGMIEQLPALKKGYKGKNPAGGRRAFAKYGGVGPLPALWMRGVGEGEIRVKLQIMPGQLTLIPW